MKSYTDIEQSKVLSEILPLESADMFYPTNSDWEGKIIGLLDVPLYIGSDGFVDTEMGEIYAWSLAALLDLCPTINGKQPILTRGKLTSLWYCYYEDEIDTQTYENPIDACYEMITRLNELNLL